MKQYYKFKKDVFIKVDYDKDLCVFVDCSFRFLAIRKMSINFYLSLEDLVEINESTFVEKYKEAQNQLNNL